MQIKWRYDWGSEMEKEFSKVESQVMKDVSRMITNGCNLKDVKTKFKQLELSK
jgi:hypothetical protein